MSSVGLNFFVKDERSEYDRFVYFGKLSLL